MQVECPVTGGPTTSVQVTVKFLHLVNRIVGELPSPLTEMPPYEPEFRAIESMVIGDHTYQAWQEAIERAVELPEIELAKLSAQPFSIEHRFPYQRQWEPLRDATGEIVGILVRAQQSVSTRIEIASEAYGNEAWKLSVRVFNTTRFGAADPCARDDALLRSLASTHAILCAHDGGAFASLTDPPDELRAIAAKCQNVGAWPVLVGEAGERDAVLASPIILYDYPQIAPESPGDLFDATEIDEILTLRILTLGEQEKKDAADVDPRASLLLARTESIAREQLMRLHGTIRGMRPVAAAKEEPRHG
jgi:hydrogenase maturation protease